MPNFWKIVCLSCGVNCDLLQDKIGRVICKECLDKAEFNEINSPLEDFDEDSSCKVDVLDSNIE
jgi:hypothetical protein